MKRKFLKKESINPYPSLIDQRIPLVRIHGEFVMVRLRADIAGLAGHIAGLDLFYVPDFGAVDRR